LARRCRHCSSIGLRQPKSLHYCRGGRWVPILNRASPFLSDDDNDDDGVFNTNFEGTLLLLHLKALFVLLLLCTLRELPITHTTPSADQRNSPRPASLRRYTPPPHTPSLSTSLRGYHSKILRNLSSPLSIFHHIHSVIVSLTDRNCVGIEGYSFL